ncbi:glycosyltransferase [Occallatibacter riparius]|uniref:Glycosyltransferase n=1 Tax=Occallatibacter riparius TaxID=1002689 RepID=A0A9J7BPJ9_9BACT|nr:nucleotide disphospho-sugar-binding domain-containing protein [Occallatibacter riparius]UWZ84457.1 glycosyltransferase [Occallatibacter riparius]
MDILLPTLGSAGDVHPAIALATALKSRGHNVTVITNEYFSAQIESAGLGFIHLGTLADAERIIADPRLYSPTKSFDVIAQMVILPNLEPLYRILDTHRTPSTVIVASTICLGARIASEKLGIPMATIHLQPSVIRSLTDAGRQGRIPMGPSAPLWWKRFIYKLIDGLYIDRQLAPSLNRFRTSLGLPPIKRIFAEWLHSPQLVLGLFPEWWGPIQPDWPVALRLTGFVLHDAAGHYDIPPEVEDFLAAGPPPIVFTPGSAGANLHTFFRESVAACRLTGHRAMLVTSFPDQLPPDLPPNVRAFPYLPFSQILPRAAALVHPGGIGTIAQAVRAGIPQLVVPYGNDQPDNALRLERLRLGVSIYPERYKAARVARALHALLDSPEIKANALRYSARIDTDAALNQACDAIEQLSQHQTRA